MIKYNELRVGNLILANGKTITVESVDEYGINLEADYYGGDVISTSLEREYELEDLNGIELTEEWLLKLGFVKTINNKDSGYVQYGITKNGFDIMFCIECNSRPEAYLCNVGIDIKSVHELQNLFQALCGEELTIKE